MKILYILNSGKPGGMEKHVADLVDAMVAHGHKVYVWCNSGDIVEWYRRYGAQVTVTSIRWDIDPLYIIKLWLFLIRHRIDVLHVHEIKAVVNGLIAGFISATPVRISHTHTPISEWTTSPFSKRINLLVQRIVVNLYASSEIALTPSRKKVKISEGISPDKLTVIPNCVDDAYLSLPISAKEELNLEYRKKFGIPQNAYVIGNISRLTQEKGTHYLLQAFVEEFAGISDVYLFLGGGGLLEEELRSEYSKYKNVVISGIFAEEDKLGYYSLLDTFVFPTLAEGFGIVLIEALALHKEVISNSLPVLQEVAPEGVKYIDTTNLAVLRAELRKSYDSFKNLGRAPNDIGYELVKNLYTKDKFYKNYLSLYESINAR